LLLDQAVAMEHAGDFAAAGSLYRQALALTPGSRPALLGLARVARAQYRLDDARAIYEQLLQRDPQDAEANNGMAWIALANHRTAAARDGFSAVLAREPGNAEAAAGLAGTAASHRIQLDVTGGYLHNDTGSAWSGGATLAADLDARQSLELGLRHNCRELVSANPLDSSRLPSNLLRAGYRWQIPSQYGLGLAYENRARSDEPAEQRLELSAFARLNQRVEVFGAVRKSFGTGWNGRLVQGGATVSLAGPWSVSATLYADHTPNFGSAHVASADLVHQGAAGALLVVGASHGNNPRFNDVHGRAVIPVSRDQALLVSARYNSFLRESELQLGWRFYWK